MASEQQAACNRPSQPALSEQPLALLNSLLRNAPVGITFFDTALRYLMVSDDFALNHDMPAEAYIGRTVREVVPYIADLIEPVMRRVIESGEPTITELSYAVPQHPRDSRHWLVTLYPLRDGAGAVIGVGGVRVDITDRKRAEQQVAGLTRSLQSRVEELQTLADRMGRLQAITAAFGEVLTTQQVAQTLLSRVLDPLGASAGGIGLLRDDGVTLELAYTIGYDATLVEQFRLVPLSPDAPYTDVPRTGNACWFASRNDVLAAYPALQTVAAEMPEGAVANLPLVANRQMIGVLAIQFAAPRSFPDDDRAFITALAQQCALALERARSYEAQQQARALAEAAVRVRDSFLTVAAHELKTPLTALLGQAQLVQRRTQRDGTLSERDKRSLQVIVEQTGRINTMVTDLLDVARLEGGQLQIERAPLDLAALVRRVVEEQPPTAQGHTLVADLPAQPLLLAADRLRIEQVLQNLLSNAIKYSPQGGAVRVSVERWGEQARLVVHDQGVGIPTDALPHLFTKFYRASNAQTSVVSGAGIGLYVVREIVGLHGGTVDVSSTPGQGTAFTVTLPL